MAAVHYVKDEENTAHRLANELQQAGHTFDMRWSRFLRQAVKVDLLTKRMIHHEDTQTVYS
jgi:hypothetical protein